MIKLKVITSNPLKIIIYCDYCFPVKAVGKYKDKDLCKDCLDLQ